MEEIKKYHVVIALGSNLGDKDQNLRVAIDEMRKSIGEIDRISRFMESNAWGYESTNSFLNACVTCFTQLTPHELLAALKKIEGKMGRVKRKETYEDRCIDLDIIFYHDQFIHTNELNIPHLHFKSREFVLKPLLEIVQDKDVFYQFISS